MVHRLIVTGSTAARLHRRLPSTAASQSAYNSTLATVFGTTEPAGVPIMLRCGPIRVEVHEQTGQIDTVTVSGVEVCRGINFIARDAAWGTVSQVQW